MERLATRLTFSGIPTEELLNKARELFPDARVRAAILIQFTNGIVMSVEGVVGGE
jgi:hypothetical protein